MDIAKDFGLDPILLSAQVINFLIVLYIFRKLLYKPILNLLEKRQETIKTGLKQAEESSKTLIRIQEEEKRILRDAHEKAKKIVEEAKLSAINLQEQLENEAKANAEKLINSAKEEIKLETQKMEKNLSVNAGMLAIKFLQESLKDFFSEKEQREVTKKALQMFKKIN